MSLWHYMGIWHSIWSNQTPRYPKTIVPAPRLKSSKITQHRSKSKGTTLDQGWPGMTRALNGIQNEDNYVAKKGNIHFFHFFGIYKWRVQWENHLQVYKWRIFRCHVLLPQGRDPAWWLPRKLDDKTPRLRVCPEIRLPQWAEQIKKT